MVRLKLMNNDRKSPLLLHTECGMWIGDYLSKTVGSFRLPIESDMRLPIESDISNELILMNEGKFMKKKILSNERIEENFSFHFVKAQIFLNNIFIKIYFLGKYRKKI